MLFPLLLAVALGLFVFWIGMLVDCLRNEHDNNKIAWVVVLIFLPVIGSLLYLFMRFLRPRTLRD